MIIVKIKGGLGNQLFQYSFAKLISIKRKDTLKLDIENLGAKKDTCRDYLLLDFNIKADIASKREVNQVKNNFGFLSPLIRLFKTKVLKIYNISYNKKLLKSKSNYFEGYFQSCHYLDPIRDYLLEELSLKNDLGLEACEILKKIKERPSVSVHVRRGDYISKKYKKIYQTFGLDYYQKSFDYFNKQIDNPNFFVFSDDIAWARDNFKEKNIIFVSDKKIKDSEEMILMSSCKHNIIANSTFSFWGAWLNKNENKIVICPKKWDNSFIKEGKDLIPNNWLRF